MRKDLNVKVKEFEDYCINRDSTKLLTIDDVRIADSNKTNDNDIRAFKDGMTFTIQTYLNMDITEKEINETVKDIEKEKVSGAIIFSNRIVNKDIVELAKKNKIIIWDRDVLLANI